MIASLLWCVGATTSSTRGVRSGNASPVSNTALLLSRFPAILFSHSSGRKDPQPWKDPIRMAHPAQRGLWEGSSGQGKHEEVWLHSHDSGTGTRHFFHPLHVALDQPPGCSWCVCVRVCVCMRVCVCVQTLLVACAVVFFSGFSPTLYQTDDLLCGWSGWHHKVLPQPPEEQRQANDHRWSRLVKLYFNSSNQ